jgi:hypothetical protein
MIPFLVPGTLILLIGLLVGYSVGRRHGLHTGFKQGLLFAPLELRRYNCEKGYCVLCTSSSPLTSAATQDGVSDALAHPGENQ